MWPERWAKEALDVPRVVRRRRCRPRRRRRADPAVQGRLAGGRAERSPDRLGSRRTPPGRGPGQAKGLAEAAAIRARAQALAENQEAVIAQQLAERWPEVVEAGAKAFGGVDHMVVLNGAQGVEELLAKALTLGGTGMGLARALLNGASTTSKSEPFSPSGGLCDTVILKDGDGLAQVAGLGGAA
ncbi:flotillin domain-containing protein, partial [Nonomuraea cavernae]|uniref:flotillin domain-containing protein n=1 Tax=Nonomuraea cavernae TaxID=2045107 RepID=UPI0033C8C24A